MTSCPPRTVDADIAGPKYRVLDRVGYGQFGQVFCGIHRQTGRIVALKRLDSRQLTTTRFLHELNLLASLQHPNIVAFQTLEYGDTGRYLVMDYCEGGTLRQLLDAPEPLPLHQSVQIVVDILQGLGHAHEHQVVHCDLKPENILLTLTATGWTAHLSDFGVARLLSGTDPDFRRGDTGSPAYMAPEQFYSRHCPASDLYAVGVLLYELVVGERPFSGTPGDLMAAHLNQPVQVPDAVPDPVRDVIQRAMQKLPQHRFASAKDMLMALQIASTESPENQPVLVSVDAPVDQEALTSPISTLVVDASQLYVGEASTLICRSVDGKTLGPITQRYSLPETEQIIQISKGTNGFWVKTQDTAVQKLSWLSTGSTEETATWQASSLKMAVNTESTWMALATGADAFQILGLPTLQSSRTVEGTVTHLLALDRRHGLALSPEDGHERLRLFNRRGDVFDYGRLPVPIEQVLQHPKHPYRILALSVSEGFLVDLNPLRLKRLVLPLKPILAATADWGYLVADAMGHVALFDVQGHLLAQLEISLETGARVSAIATISTLLIVATWSGQQGTLSTFDLQPFITPEH